MGRIQHESIDMYLSLLIRMEKIKDLSRPRKGLWLYYNKANSYSLQIRKARGYQQYIIRESPGWYIMPQWGRSHINKNILIKTINLTEALKIFLSGGNNANTDA